MSINKNWLALFGTGFKLTLVAAFLLGQFTGYASALSEEQKKLYNKNILYYDLSACNEAAAESEAGESNVGGNLKELAVQMLNNNKISYWTNNGINTRDVVVALSKGEKAFTTSNDPVAAANRKVDLNPTILKFILEVAKSDKIMVNALTDKDHSSGSNHYKGLAVDLDVGNSASLSILDPSAKKYGGVKNSETSHHHYDFLESDNGDSGSSATDQPDATAGCECGGESSTNLVGSENAEKIFNFFVSAGLKPYMAAGIMGNMKTESGLNPRALEPGTTGDAPIAGRGYGLVQWTFPSRQDPLIAKAKKAGKKVYDLGIQLDYVMDELKGSHKSAGDNLKKSKNVQEATLIIETQYEVHAGGVQPQRTADAKSFLAKYGSNTGGGGSSSSDTSACTTSEGGSGEVTGEYSLPLPKKLYSKNPGLFTRPHHDYPAVDIMVPTGTNVYSMRAGKVIQAPTSGACGTGIIIDTDDGVRYTYCHGSDGGSIKGAKQGDTVKPGQLIMHSASTGSSSGPHLHLQIDAKGPRCPQKLFASIVRGSPIKESSLPTSGCVG